MREPREVLERSATIAVVGASRHAHKAAHSVPADMQRHGWRIIPVNPTVTQLFGERAYPSLIDIPDRIDLVNVFRPAREAAEVVRQAIAIGAPAVWLQLGIASALARQLAEDAGLDYIEDRCIAVERAVAALSRSRV
jgi:predicted CoA-binding protein